MSFAAPVPHARRACQPPAAARPERASARFYPIRAPLSPPADGLRAPVLEFRA